MLSSQGARVGIHQCLVFDSLSGSSFQSIKANVSARVAFKVTSSYEARAAGFPGAEKLTLGKVTYTKDQTTQSLLQSVFTPEDNAVKHLEAVKESKE